MAVVLRLPDRSASGPKRAEMQKSSAEIVILPCIRREALERRPAVSPPTGVRGQQLQA